MGRDIGSQILSGSLSRRNWPPAFAVIAAHGSRPWCNRFAGLVVAYAFYWEAFISVWCFFAAAASVAILCHFEWLRRSSLRIAGP